MSKLNTLFLSLLTHLSWCWASMPVGFSTHPHPSCVFSPTGQCLILLGSTEAFETKYKNLTYVNLS